MSWSHRIRPLYLLALFQLVAGPLALFSVTVFCQQTIPKVADHGVTGAVSLAWKSPEFQCALAFDISAADRSKKSPQAPDPGSDPVKVKMPGIAWHAAPLLWIQPSRRGPSPDFARCWTPALPLPPPGPPPRVG